MELGFNPDLRPHIPHSLAIPFSSTKAHGTSTRAPHQKVPAQFLPLLLSQSLTIFQILKTSASQDLTKFVKEVGTTRHGGLHSRHFYLFCNLKHTP